jgi:hypothetical protein
MATFHNPQQLGGHLLAEFKAGNLCSMTRCEYRAGGTGKPCAIGLFLPKRLVRSIHEQGHSELTVTCLQQVYKFDIEKYFAGLNLKEIARIQAAFDSGSRARFMRTVKTICGLPITRKVKK